MTIEPAMRVTMKMISALELLLPHGISPDDSRAEKYSDDGNPDTWNRLFDAGLAVQSGPGFSGDDFWLSITPSGIAWLEAMKVRAP